MSISLEFWLKLSLQWVHWAHKSHWESFLSSSSLKLRATNMEDGDGESQGDEQQTTAFCSRAMLTTQLIII